MTKRTKPVKTAVHILMHIGKLLQETIASELKPYGLHHGQGRILAILERDGPMTQADLARVTDLKPATITNMLKPLEKRTLIVRHVDKKTNRAMVVKLTKEGMALSEQVNIAWLTVDERLTHSIPQEEKEFLFAHLEGFRDTLKTQ